MKFSDEELKDFLQKCSIEDLIKKQQAAWDEKGGIVKAAVQFLVMKIEVSPWMRAALEFANNNGDIEKTQKEWGEVAKLIRFYLDEVEATLDIFAKTKEQTREKE